MNETHINKILRFKESDWMKIYINFNTKKRQNATNSFTKNFLKLIISSVFGKAMENCQTSKQ